MRKLSTFTTKKKKKNTINDSSSDTDDCFDEKSGREGGKQEQNQGIISNI